MRLIPVVEQAARVWSRQPPTLNYLEVATCEIWPAAQRSAFATALPLCAASCGV